MMGLVPTSPGGSGADLPRQDQGGTQGQFKFRRRSLSLQCQTKMLSPSSRDTHISVNPDGTGPGLPKWEWGGPPSAVPGTVPWTVQVQLSPRQIKVEKKASDLGNTAAASTQRGKHLKLTGLSYKEFFKPWGWECWVMPDSFSGAIAPP